MWCLWWQHHCLCHLLKPFSGSRIIGICGENFIISMCYNLLHHKTFFIFISPWISIHLFSRLKYVKSKKCTSDLMWVPEERHSKQYIIISGATCLLGKISFFSSNQLFLWDFCFPSLQSSWTTVLLCLLIVLFMSEQQDVVKFLAKY